MGSGAIGLARWTDGPGDSQWFITEKPAIHLSQPSGAPGDVFGACALFGQVFEDMGLVRKVAEAVTPPNDRPIVDVMLELAQMLPPPGDATLLGLSPQVLEPFDLWMVRGAALEAPKMGIVGGLNDVPANGAASGKPDWRRLRL